MDPVLFGIGLLGLILGGVIAWLLSKNQMQSKVSNARMESEALKQRSEEAEKEVIRLRTEEDLLEHLCVGHQPLARSDAPLQ